MADFESLKSVVADCRQTLVNSAKTIRALIVQRNDALAAADPKALEAARVQRSEMYEAADMQAGLEQARLDTQAAIDEAGAVPTFTPALNPTETARLQELRQVPPASRTPAQTQELTDLETKQRSAPKPKAP